VKKMNPRHEELMYWYKSACINKDHCREMELHSQIIDRMRSADPAICEDCGAETPHGYGLGVSLPEDLWTDRSHARPVKVVPLCGACLARRVYGDPRR